MLFLMNGVEYTGAAENNLSPGGTSQQLLSVDAVREFNVLRDSYGAEYGKHPGGQVIIVTLRTSHDNVGYRTFGLGGKQVSVYAFNGDTLDKY
jgi:hypothetical protein